MKKVILCLLALLLSGCYSTAYYNTLQDSEYQINKANAVSVFLPADSSVETRQFARLLSYRLAQNGFIVADNAKCGLVFNLQEPTYQSVGAYTTYNTFTSYTNISGFVGNTYVYGSGQTTTTTPQTNFYTYSTTYKKIYLDFACLNSNNELQSVWEGFASATLNDFRAHPEKMVDNLVALVGENYTGHLRISGNQNVKATLKTQKSKNWLMLNFDIGCNVLNNTTINPTLSLSEYGFYDDISVAESDLTLPINFRVGYARVISPNFLLGANLTYTKNLSASPFVEIRDGEYVYGKTLYSSAEQAEIKSQQVGVELMSIYRGWLVGVGVSKDIGSSVSFPVNGTTITKDIEGWYLPIRLGYMWGIDGIDLGISAEMGTSLHLSGNPYRHNQFSMSIGFMYLIDLW